MSRIRRSPRAVTTAFGLGALLGSVSAFAALGACSSSDATADTSDASAEASDGADSGDASDGFAREASSMATVTSLVARAIGRDGGDLQVTVQGEDPTQTAYGAHIRVRDSQSNKVLAFEGNWNGPEPGVLGEKAAERRVLFDPSDDAGRTTFTRTVTLPGITESYPSIARIDFAVLTAVDKHSIKHFAEVTPQAKASLGKTCDPAFVTDRCAAGLGCTATPPTCALAVAPAVDLLAYVPGPDGPHMLLRGADPAGVVDGILIEFLDGVGGPQMIDLGNANFTTSQELKVGAGWSAGSFFLDYVAPLGFEGTVSRIAATPVGANKGARTTAAFGAVPRKPAGQVCDPRGFTGCAVGNVCERDAKTQTNVCVGRGAAKASVVAAARVIDLGAGQSWATGYARGTSLWDPPASCVATSAMGRPEGIVRLHVPADVASLTISTAVEETNFDTLVYLLAGAGETEDSAIDCNDDVSGSAGALTLQNVRAGDYLIVVDSKSMTGGQFGVKVQ